MPSGSFEFKLAVRGADGESLLWQPGENRCLEVPSDPAVLQVQVAWEGEAAVEVLQPPQQPAPETPAPRSAASADPDEQVFLAVLNSRRNSLDPQRPKF